MSCTSKKNCSRIAIIPRAADILCGKTATNRHPGNIYFRELILSKVDVYAITKKRKVKGQIVADVLSLLKKNGARFLKLTNDATRWRLIPRSHAHEKVSHAIRDRVTERKRGRLVMPNVSILMSPPGRQQANGISFLLTGSTQIPNSNLLIGDEQHSAALLLNQTHFPHEGTYTDVDCPSLGCNHTKHGINAIPVDQGRRPVLPLHGLSNHQGRETSGEEAKGIVPRSASALMCRYQENISSLVAMTTAPIIARIEEEDEFLEAIANTDFLQHEGNTAKCLEACWLATGTDIVEDDEVMSTSFLDEYNDMMLGEMLPTGEELSRYLDGTMLDVSKEG